MPSDGNDVALWERVRAGDADALTHVIKKYNDPLVSFLRFMSLTHHDAEDVAQTVWKVVVANLAEICPEGSPVAWVYRIARNRALDLKRKRNPQRRELVSTDLNQSSNDESFDLGNLEPAEELETLPPDPADVELREVFERCLDRLDKPLRDVLLLHFRAANSGVKVDFVNLELAEGQQEVRVGSFRTLLKVTTLDQENKKAEVELLVHDDAEDICRLRLLSSDGRRVIDERKSPFKMTQASACSHSPSTARVSIGTTMIPGDRNVRLEYAFKDLTRKKIAEILGYASQGQEARAYKQAKQKFLGYVREIYEEKQ